MASDLEHPIAWRFLQTIVLILWSVVFIFARLFGGLHVGLERLLTLLDTFLVNRNPPSDAQPEHKKMKGRPNIFPPIAIDVFPAVSIAISNSDVEGWSSLHSVPAIQKPYNCTLGCTKLNKYYAVARGRVPNIYQTWAETHAQVHEFSGALHKSFKSLSEAEDWQEREFIAMGLKWRKKDVGPEHRQNVDFLGLDDHDHAVYTCRCCDEVYCHPNRF